MAKFIRYDFNANDEINLSGHFVFDEQHHLYPAIINLIEIFKHNYDIIREINLICFGFYYGTGDEYNGDYDWELKKDDFQFNIEDITDQEKETILKFFGEAKSVGAMRYIGADDGLEWIADFEEDYKPGRLRIVFDSFNEEADKEILTDEKIEWSDQDNTFYLYLNNGMVLDLTKEYEYRIIKRDSLSYYW